MSLGLFDHNPRYRKRSWQRMRFLLLALMCLGAILAVGYHFGANAEKARQRAFLNDYQQKTESNEVMRAQVTDLETVKQTLEIKLQQLQTRYDNDVPEGRLAELTKLVAAQLEKGISEDRLSFVIRSAQPPRNCSDPQNKRFVVSTPVYQGPQSSVSFADGAITVTAEGQAAQNREGQPEAWFDTGKPVSITFTRLGGETETKTAKLPLHHAIVMADKEYRFTLSEGPRSFIVVTGDVCDYF